MSLLALFVVNLPSVAVSENEFSLQVGATGDDASRGNSGVRAEILTHAYRAASMGLDYFWVGTVLQTGAFVQFGYALEPGQYCLKGMYVGGQFLCLGGSDTISNLDARWQWQYWPNLYSKDFDYEIGPAQSAGSNGTWHLYSIVPSPTGGVSFTLDGVNIATINSHIAPSQEPAMMVAEKAGSGGLGSLGPVEFRNMAYLKEDGWHLVDSLVSLSGCGINSSCPADNPYGVSARGPNHIIAGSGVGFRRGGELLWTTGYVTLEVRVHPQVEFRIASISGEKTYVGNASVNVPKGLFVHISLVEVTRRTDGFLGTLGAKDEFQGWSGDLSSANQTVQLLMNHDKELIATWRMDYDSLIISVILFVGLAVVATCLLMYRHARKSGRER